MFIYSYVYLSIYVNIFLDLEGAEESALQGTDFSMVHFNAVAMECDDHDISKNKRKTDILEANGFKCTLVERNCMCKHRDFKPSSAAEKSTLRKWDGNKWSSSYKASDTSLDSPAKVADSTTARSLELQVQEKNT